MQEHKDELARFYGKNRRMPTYSEMMRLFGYKSKSAVAYAVDKLIESGVVHKDTTGKLILHVENDLKVLGLVEAGFPTSAQEELIDTMSLDEYLIDNADATYMLTVKGDSMIDAGILEGDMVIVERGKTPKAGDIVIAEIDGGYTMKYYRLKNKKPFLEPANTKYKPIYPESTLTITAIVKAVVRKY